MTKIDLDTSPLQAAREWRGASLVSVAMNCGLPVTQAEALETGDLDAFDSVDEMIAAAVVYGAAMGIGRDEATALLDRTVRREALVADVPDAEEGDAGDARPNGAFSDAVQGRSARIAGMAAMAAAPAILVEALDDEGEGDEAGAPVLHVPLDEPVGPAALDEDLPEVPTDPSVPTPEQAVAASGELHLDDAFGPDAPWEASGNTGELEAWVDDFDDYDSPVAARPEGAGVLARVGSGSHAALERIIGSDRADAVADRTREVTVRMTELARQGREQLRRSEHATLIVAIGAGAILIAIVVALGGALGGDEPVDPAGSNAAATAPAGQAAAADVTAKQAAKPAPANTPMIAPSKLNVDVYNAGSQKGKAKTVADKIRGFGYRIGEVTNAKGNYPSARIIHPRSMAREARLLGRRTGITTLQVAPGTSRRITVIVT